jgi:hypothetical protein
MENEQLLPDYGTLFTLQDFIEECSKGMFIDDDGIGFYSDGRVYWRNEPARPSDMIRFKGVKFDMRHRFVIWFNK